MYRDDATALDEHDRAVGAILIAETLVGQCERAAERVTATHATASNDRWRAVRELHEDYPEIWRQLDRAKKVLEARGANTMGYAEQRPHVKPTLAIARDDLSTAIERDALEDARRAIAALKLAVPGADWKAIDKRTHELVEMPQLRRRHRLVASGVVGAFVAGVLGYFFAITPAKRPDPAAEMRRELAGIASERKLKIEQLGIALGDRCDPPLAHEYTKQLAMDGRKDDALAFADRYTARCGEDRVVANWANAPRVR